MQWYAAAAVAPKMQCGAPERRRRRRAWRITDLDSSSPAAPDAAPFPTNFTPIPLLHLRAIAPPLSRRRIPPLRTTRLKLFLSTLHSLLYSTIYTFTLFSFHPPFSFFCGRAFVLLVLRSNGRVTPPATTLLPLHLFYTRWPPPFHFSRTISVRFFSPLRSRLLFSSRRGLPRPWKIGRQQSDCLVAQQRAVARRRRWEMVNLAIVSCCILHEQMLVS